MPNPSDFRPGIWASIAAAFRQNRWPCLFLNALVIALVTSYYRWPAVAGLWNRWVTSRRGGLSFSRLVPRSSRRRLLPFAAQWAMHTLPADGRFKTVVLARCLLGLPGHGDRPALPVARVFYSARVNDVKNLAIKVAMDQLVYSALWAVPTYVIALRWVDLGGSWSRTRASLDGHFWKHTYPTVLFTNWIIWFSHCRAGLCDARRPSVPRLLGGHVLLHPGGDFAGAGECGGLPGLPQRGYGLQPRVGANATTLGIRIKIIINPEGVAPVLGCGAATHSGCENLLGA